jgi:hypothetical protein
LEEEVKTGERVEEKGRKNSWEGEQWIIVLEKEEE